MLVGILLVATLALTPPARAGTFVSDRLAEEVASSDMLGGGDYVLIRFGDDAAFGVLWGNDTNHNHIYVVVLKARYLGLAQVYDAAGRLITQNVPVKYWTLYAMKLLDLVEYREGTTGDTVANYTRGYDAGTGNFTTFTEVDSIPKRVDLSTNWTRGAISRSSTATERSWSFNLTAEDLPYLGVNNAPTPPGDGILNRVEFTFHLNASLEQVDNVTVPEWRVTVDTSRARPFVLDLDRLGNVTRGGTVARYALKWDQEITGWDFESGGPAGSRRLLLEFAAIVGNLIPPYIANWVDENLVRTTNETGRVQYRTDAGNETLDNRTGNRLRPLRSPYLDFGGDWSRIGRFTWVSTDIAGRPVYAQILAGHAIAARGPYGGAFVGFIVLGAISYAADPAVVGHDPGVTTDVIAELVPTEAGDGRIFIAVAVVIAIVLIGVLALVVTRRRKPET